jgi:hypothetical protein
MARRQPGLGGRLLLALLLIGLGLTWWSAPSFFGGGRQGVCGLELRYPASLSQVEVARADGRDAPRPAVSGSPLAIPCGQPLVIYYSRARTHSGEALGSTPETRALTRAELKPGVTVVELR